MPLIFSPLHAIFLSSFFSCMNRFLVGLALAIPAVSSGFEKFSEPSGFEGIEELLRAARAQGWTTEDLMEVEDVGRVDDIEQVGEEVAEDSSVPNRISPVVSKYETRKRVKVEEASVIGAKKIPRSMRPWLGNRSLPFASLGGAARSFWLERLAKNRHVDRQFDKQFRSLFPLVPLATARHYLLFLTSFSGLLLEDHEFLVRYAQGLAGPPRAASALLQSVRSQHLTARHIVVWYDAVVLSKSAPIVHGGDAVMTDAQFTTAMEILAAEELE